MVKTSCSANYRPAKVARLLDIAREDLPSAKDEWERVASTYNERRTGGGSSATTAAYVKRSSNYTLRESRLVTHSSPNVRTSTDIKAAIDTRVGGVVIDDASDDAEFQYDSDDVNDSQQDSHGEPSQEIQLSRDSVVTGMEAFGLYSTLSRPSATASTLGEGILEHVRYPTLRTTSNRHDGAEL